MNLGFTQIYLKLMIDGVSSQPFSAMTTPPIKEPETSVKQQVIESSRKQFGMIRETVEQEVIEWHMDKGQGAPKKLESGLGKETIPAKSKSTEQPVTPPPARVFEKPKYTRRENVLPARPKPEPLDDDFVPLEELKPKINSATPIVSQNNNSSTKKAVNEKSLAELRAVLQSFNSQKKPETNNDKAVEVKNAPPPMESKPKEIPEEKLRQMLRVEQK